MTTLQLFRALNDGNLQRACQLLEDGADPNHVLEEGGVAGVASMHMAVGLSAEALRLLLEYGGDPNVRSIEGLTPLHIAATWGELDSVKLLLFNGGDPSLKDQDGLRAVDVGRSYSHSEVVCFLEYYSLLLIPEGEDETELRYTRESLDAGGDSLSRNTTPDVLNLSFQEDCSPDQSLTTAAHRSSVTTALQQKLDRCVQHGEHVCMDVTSPSHPYLERKSGATNEQELCSGECKTGLKWTPRKQQTCMHQELKQRTCRGLFEGDGDRCRNCNGDRHGEFWRVHEDCGYYWRGRHCGHDTHVSFTDSDPDCWEGGQGDEVRDRLRDFHKSCLRIRKPTANSGCFENHYNRCDQTFSSNCKHCSNSTPYCHKDSRQGINYSDHGYESRDFLNRSCDHGQSHNGYYGYEGGAQNTVKKMPKKIPSDPVVPKWTLLKDKQETSAEKVGRWQSSLSSGLHRPPLCEIGYKSSNTDDAHFSPSRFIHSPKLSEVKKSPMSQNSSPNRFFPPLSDHQYSVFSPSAVYDRSIQSGDSGKGILSQEQSPKSSLGFSTPTKSETGSRIHSGNSGSSPNAVAPRTPESRSSCKSVPRRSSIYTQNIQRELEKHLQDGHQVCLDVTSPGHPFVDFKSKELQKLLDTTTVLSPVERVSHVRSPGDASGARGKRLSTVSSVSASSCDTFVTCEDDTEFTLVTPLDPTVSANLDTQSFSSGTSEDSIVLNVKAVVTDENKSAPKDSYQHFGISCSVCDDKDKSQCKVVLTEESKKRESSPTTLRLTSPVKHNRHPSHPLLDDELDLTGEIRQGNGCKTADPDKSSYNVTPQNNKALVQTVSRTFSPSKHHWQHPVPDKVLDVSDLITSDDNFIQRKHKKTNKARNITGNVTPRHSGKNDLAGCYSKWLPPSDMNQLEDTDLISSDESFQIREREKKAKDGDRITSLVNKLKKVSVNTGMRTAPLKSGKRSPVKPGNKRVSMDSFCSNTSVREYLYKDKEKGITLLERYVPSECDESSTRESLDSTCSSFTINSEDTEIYDWQDYQSDTDDGKKVIGQDGEPKKPAIPQSMSQLSNQAIRKKLLSFGDDPGPVTGATRQTYLVRLASLEADPTRAHMMKLTVDGPEYSPELHAALQNNLDCEGVDDLEDKLVASFQNSQGRIWREGTLKSSFNYLLLDPRVTKNLPYRAKTLGEGETFKAFIHAIFYVGKGKRARPYCHLYEAISHMQKPKPKVSTKVQHIIDIWNEGLGVVSLHCFQSVIPVEAYTREACMVEAIGLTKLTNMKRGDYYGVASTWSLKTKRKMGVYLLKKALQIFLSEGERQICPVDIKGGQ